MSVSNPSALTTHSQHNILEPQATEPSLQFPTREYLEKNVNKPDLQKRCRELGLTKVWVTKDELINMILQKCYPDPQATNDSASDGPEVAPTPLDDSQSAHPPNENTETAPQVRVDTDETPPAPPGDLEQAPLPNDLRPASVDTQTVSAPRDAQTSVSTTYIMGEGDVSQTDLRMIAKNI